MLVGKKYTKKETDFWGNEKEVHYEDGKKVGETKFRETFWGNKVQDHYDTSGNKIGETRKEEGFFSNKAVHYDSNKNKIGYTKDDKTFFGDKIQRHYDKSGKQVGKSHYEEGFFGGRKKVHEGEYLKSRRDEDTTSSSYGSFSESSSRESPIGFGKIILIVVFVTVGIGFFSKNPRKSNEVIKDNKRTVHNSAQKATQIRPVLRDTNSYFSEKFSVSVNKIIAFANETVLDIKIQNLTEKRTKILFSSGKSNYSLGKETFIPLPFLRDEKGNEYLARKPAIRGVEALVFEDNGWGGITTIKVGLPPHAEVLGNMIFPKLPSSTNRVTLTIPGVNGWQTDLVIPGIIVMASNEGTARPGRSNDLDNTRLVSEIEKHQFGSQVVITHSGVAEKIGPGGNPVGVNSIFYGNGRYDKNRRDSVAYFARFTGAVPERTLFETKLYFNGSEQASFMFKCGSSTAKSRDGIFSCQTSGYYLPPGDWEIRLFANNREVDRTQFKIVPSAASHKFCP